MPEAIQKEGGRQPYLNPVGIISKTSNSLRQSIKMAVTEFALIRLPPTYDELELYEVLMQNLELQDDWIREHQPHLLPSTATGNLTTAFIAKTDPAYLLLIAPWDSPEGHKEWIASDVNQKGMAELQSYFAKGDDAVVLFHMSAAGKQKGPPPEFREHKCFEVDRIFVPKSERETVQGKYKKLEDALLDLKLGDHVWGGWRIEPTSDDADELVVFSSHTHFPVDKAVQKLSVSQQKETRCFHHIG